MQVPEAAVCNACGKWLQPIRDSDRCAVCEAVMDLGAAAELCIQYSDLAAFVRAILQRYWQRVGVPRPEPDIVAPRPGDKVVIDGREISVPDPASPSGEEQGGGGGASGTRCLSSWMPSPTAFDEGPLHATVTVAVELEGSLIRLQAQYLATPDDLRMGAASMIERLLSSWMPFPGTAFDATPVCVTVTVAVEFEGSLIRLQAQHLATPDAIRVGAKSMVDVVIRMREREVGHVSR